MSGRHFALGFALLAMFCSSEAAFARPPDTTTAIPSASAAPNACASDLPDLPDNIPAAFAYELISTKILGFISRIANVPEKQQRLFFETVVKAAGTPREAAVRTALDATCPNLDEIYGKTRALAFVQNHWTLGDLQDAKLDAFAGVVGNEISALSVGDELSADLQSAAAAPFAALAAMPEPPVDAASSPAPSRSPGASGACAETAARLIHYVEPTYPETALDMILSGRVDVRVALNAEGQVESARVYGDTLKQRVGSDDLIRETIFVAAVSSYAPATIDCKPVPSTFIFSEDFSVER